MNVYAWQAVTAGDNTATSLSPADIDISDLKDKDIPPPEGHRWGKHNLKPGEPLNYNADVRRSARGIVQFVLFVSHYLFHGIAIPASPGWLSCRSAFRSSSADRSTASTGLRQTANAGVSTHPEAIDSHHDTWALWTILLINAVLLELSEYSGNG